MVYSLRDYLFQPRNLQLDDPAIPNKLDLQAPPAPRSKLPEVPPIFPQPNPDNPWGDPHYIDPPNENPSNYPGGKFVVTENASRQADGEPGGLLGLLLAAMRQGQVRPGAETAFDPDTMQMYAASPQDAEQNPQAVNVLDAATPNVDSRMLSRTVSSAFANRNPTQITSPQRGAPLGLVSGKPMPQWPFPPAIFSPRR